MHVSSHAMVARPLQATVTRRRENLGQGNLGRGGRAGGKSSPLADLVGEGSPGGEMSGSRSPASLRGCCSRLCRAPRCSLVCRLH